VTVFVDGNNVIGTRPDGWWRDRPAAVRRLLSRLQCYVRRCREPVVLVLDVPQPDLPEGDHEGVTVRYPARRGRNAADERILQLLGEEGLRVVTSDRELAAEAGRSGAVVVGASAFLAELDEADC
jgi:predicted RNA-binding protein with PIN domain